MPLQDDLLEMEKTLWSGGAEAYRRTLDDDCIAFTGSAGVSSREEIAGQADGMRWRDVEIEIEGFLRPADDVAILTYRASALRGDDEPYRVLVSSGYVKRDGKWKMVFHQRVPCDPR